MKERRKKIMKRLVLEELERRAMLAGPPEIAMEATALTNGSYEDFYKSQVGTEIGGPAGVGMVDSDPTVPAALLMSRAAAAADAPISLFPEATTGTGQMTITTGANTPGIGSFAMPIAGPSRAGGTGTSRSGPLEGGLSKSNDPAVDAAIESLFADPDGNVDKIADDSEPAAKVTNRTATETKTSRRSFDLETEEAQSEESATTGTAR
jgi:hypothetical protein